VIEIRIPGPHQLVPIEMVIPYGRNARTHSEEQVAEIAGSLMEFGWTFPILVDEHNVVLAGHGRLLAAQKIGLQKVPILVRDDLTESQKRAYRITDNKLGLNAGWDDNMLRLELNTLELDGFDLDLLGFSEEELDALAAGADEVMEGRTDPDAVPEAPAAAVSLPGDVWVLGRHRLLCGDATRAEDVERLMEGKKADMVFTDPPYNVNYGATMKDKLRRKDRRLTNDDLGEGFEQFLHDACANMLAVTKGALYICMSSSELHTLYRAFTQSGGHCSTFIIWAKNTFTMGRADYQRQYEPMLYGWKEGADHYWCGARDQGDVWFVRKPQVNDLHPTMKPVELIERAIRNSSNGRDTVLDPFAGSGSTLIACERLRRQARLVEIDPPYCDVIIRRWTEFTGGRAVLEADGRTFEELRDERQRAAA